MLCLFFLSWLVVSGVKADGPVYLTYLTYWTFITYNSYLLVAALSSTTKYLTVHFLSPNQAYDFSRSSEYEIKKPSGCCGYADNKLSWYQSVHWLFFTLGNELPLGVLVLYWSLLSSAQRPSFTDVSIVTHLVSGLVAVLDLWISGIPVNLLHFVYLMIYASVYVLFSGIYFGATGNVIYMKFLDYGDYPGLAVGGILGVLLLAIPGLHTVVYYLQYTLKYWILYLVLGRPHRSAEPGYQEIESVTE